MCVCVCVCVREREKECVCASKCSNLILLLNSIFHLCFTVELEGNSTLNSKVWDAAGLRSNGTFPLDYFSYNNSALLDVIFRHVQRTNFSGITVSDLQCNCCSS